MDQYEKLNANKTNARAFFAKLDESLSGSASVFMSIHKAVIYSVKCNCVNEI